MPSIDKVRQGAAMFRDMHAGADLIVLPNAWDAGSAALMADAGFPVIATTSAGVAFALGYPDGERIGRKRMLEICGEIAAISPVPVTGDLEAGYGPEPEAVAATVTGAIEVGLVGCNIEDAQAGKLLDLELAVARIRAGRAAAEKAGVPFVLNARTDPYLLRFGDAATNFAESVKRANAYLEAGATCAFVPGPGDAETVGKLVQAVKGPLNIMGGPAAAGGLDVPTLQRLGVRRLSTGGAVMQAAMADTKRALDELKAGTLGFAKGAYAHMAANKLMIGLRTPKS
jgi:2-methylisocitrate lyase-like PEP mutase family enzyme